jgi:hypothetical protein
MTDYCIFVTYWEPSYEEGGMDTGQDGTDQFYQHCPEQQVSTIESTVAYLNDVIRFDQIDEFETPSESYYYLPCSLCPLNCPGKTRPENYPF